MTGPRNFAYLHTRLRLDERHRLPLSYSEYEWLCTQIQRGCPGLNPRPTENEHRKVVSLLHCGQRLDFVYDYVAGRIVTVLPRLKKKSSKSQTLNGSKRRKTREHRRYTRQFQEE